MILWRIDGNYARESLITCIWSTVKVSGVRRCSRNDSLNMPIQYSCNCFKLQKIETFQLKHLDIVLIFALNIDCGYTLEPPQ